MVTAIQKIAYGLLSHSADILRLSLPVFELFQSFFHVSVRLFARSPAVSPPAQCGGNRLDRIYQDALKRVTITIVKLIIQDTAMKNFM
jgi:hypothetical protein